MPDDEFQQLRLEHGAIMQIYQEAQIRCTEQIQSLAHETEKPAPTQPASCRSSRPKASTQWKRETRRGPSSTRYSPPSRQARVLRPRLTNSPPSFLRWRGRYERPASRRLRARVLVGVLGHVCFGHGHLSSACFKKTWPRNFLPFAPFRRRRLNNGRFCKYDHCCIDFL